MLVVCELDRKLDKAAMRKALEKALREVEVPALPPLLVCGVGFNQQAWTQRVVAEKDAAEALAQVHRCSFNKCSSFSTFCKCAIS